jgi:hypothetical protein
MKLENYNVIDLNKKDLTEISGGHKGFWYGVGEGVTSSTLLIMGVMAGMWEAITE